MSIQIDYSLIQPPYLLDTVKPGWIVRLIPNPDIKTRIEEEYIKILKYEDEVQDKWLILVYQGKDPEGYRIPEDFDMDKTKIYSHGYEYKLGWQPEYNCWREATKQEIELLYKKLLTLEAKVIQEKRSREKILTITEPGKQEFTEIELPYSYIYYLPKEKLIIKKYHPERATW